MAGSIFQLKSPYEAAGDQPQAIENLVEGYERGERHQTLMGVTGSGKTFTMANVIARLNKPTLIISHNKTLVAQLYQEFKSFFPDNAVEYFVSYYDYYQPEAYMPTTDVYIEKDSSINEEIEKLRLRTTASLMSRKDVIVLSSVSCIYGLGSPEEYRQMMVKLEVGEERERDSILRELVDVHYSRNDYEFARATFRVRGDVIEVRPAYDDFAIRIEMFGDSIEKISRVDLMTGRKLAVLDQVYIYPARHYVTQEESMERVIKDIRQELNGRLKELNGQNKLVEAQRLASRTHYDMEMLAETGFCSGIENYSRIIENREPGTPPYTLMDFFGKDYLLIIDESHVTMPQVGAMYGGDRSRKTNLVDFGFRLPCALDNRPLKFEEFEARLPNNVMYVSATPAQYEMEKCEGTIVEQIVRPTGLLDPMIQVRPIEGQMDDILEEVQARVALKERVFILTLTKKSAEDLSDYLENMGLKALYMHSDTETLKRTEILQQLRRGDIDILVGINLLREGLDVPEVSLVVILDADKEGFLRNRRTMIQIIGRAARHVHGTVLMYADRMTQSMKEAIEETNRRRKIQQSFNEEHGITPTSVVKELRGNIQLIEDTGDLESNPDVNEEDLYSLELEDETDVEELEKQMREAAEDLDFERAASLRDKIKSLRGSA